LYLVWFFLTAFPLCCATPAWQVILLQEVANFRHPQFSRVLSFGSPHCPTARCRSLHQFFSAPKDFTVASSLGTS
jgi:hypothetical protein